MFFPRNLWMDNQRRKRHKTLQSVKKLQTANVTIAEGHSLFDQDED